jgi:hypothetical protein
MDQLAAVRLEVPRLLLPISMGFADNSGSIQLTRDST